MLDLLEDCTKILLGERLFYAQMSMKRPETSTVPTPTDHDGNQEEHQEDAQKNGKGETEKAQRDDQSAADENEDQFGNTLRTFSMNENDVEKS